MRRGLIHVPDESAPTPLELIGLAESRARAPAAWLSRALLSICRLWPIVIGTRLAVLAIALRPLVGHWSDIVSGPALALLALLLAADIGLALGHRMRFRTMPPHRQLQVILAPVLLSAGGYSWLAMLAFGLAGQSDEAIVRLAILLPAIVAVSILSVQRILALAYSAATFVPLMIAYPTVLPWPLGAALLIGLALALLVQARLDGRIAHSRRLLGLRGEQALALLNEFERSGQGWFWETDRSGAITYISETLAQGLGSRADDLIGRPMGSLVRPSEGEGEAEGKRTLGFHLSARSAFSEIAVRAAIEHEERWWSISGRPVLSEHGQFLGFRGSGADLTEMRKSQAEVSRLARFDALTGLANRVQMLTTLEQSIVDPLGRSQACALFILDLDRFKQVNDTMGHPAGDALLRQVSQRLTRSAGPQAKVGRLGGDEFQIVLPGQVDRGELAKLAEAIIHSVSQPYVIDGTQVVIGVSIGIALAPDDGDDADMLTRNADLALYKAKGNGRGVFRFYSQDLHADAEDRRQLEQDLRHAISTGGLHLEYQPVVETTTERIIGFESLVRWDHPTRGAISPSTFIPVAEEAGLIAQVGEWVLRTACDDAAQWPKGVRVAVNVSAIQFVNPAFPGQVANALARSGLRPEQLELEITESVFLDESHDCDIIFQRLKGLGVRLALDDFGTGYSSLGYLKTAPIDKIKIDQSFVRGAAIKGSRNGAIVKAIVGLAEALSMDTTAEGAETLDELELIRALGCSHIQGFVYGRPERAEAVAERFARGERYARADGFKSSREPRRAMLRSVRLHHGHHHYEARIRNISAGGAMIEGLSGVPVGTRFDIAVGGGRRIAAECRWSQDDRMGVEFAERVDVPSLAPAAAPAQAPAPQPAPAVTPPPEAQRRTG